MPKAKTEVALQFSECCALLKLHCNIRFSALVPKAALQQAKNCSATLKKLRCREVPLSCGFQAPTFRHPHLGPAEVICSPYSRSDSRNWLDAKISDAFFGFQLEASCLQWSCLRTAVFGSFSCSQLELIYLQVVLFYLQLKFCCLQKENGSNKQLNGLQTKKLNCKQKNPTVSEKASRQNFSSNSRSVFSFEGDHSEVSSNGACAKGVQLRRRTWAREVWLLRPA